MKGCHRDQKPNPLNKGRNTPIRLESGPEEPGLIKLTHTPLPETGGEINLMTQFPGFQMKPQMIVSFAAGSSAGLARRAESGYEKSFESAGSQ